MPVIREWLRRLWGTFRKAPEDAVMEEELRLHLEMVAADLQRRGLTSEEAQRQARRQAGGVAQAMEQRRDRRGLPWLEDLLQDARFGARMLRRAPLVTAVALLTLTLAIGANSAIFSLVDPLLFRDVPVRDPASLVQFTYQYPRDPPLNIFGLANYEHYRDRNHVFSDLFGLATLTTESRTGEDPIAAEVVTGNFFQALGVRPALGRVLDVSDDKPGAAAAGVVSWRYWQSRFNGDQRVLGSVIDIQDTRVPVPMPVTVVGVAEPEFSGIVVGYRPDVWMSLSAIPDAMRSRAGLALAARLKPGVSIEQARAEMRVLDRARIDDLAERDPQWLRAVLDVTPARTGLSTPLHQQFGGPLLLLMAMVGGVLLLACVNIGSLLLARGAARQQEMAVRVSLGAGRFRIVRQVLTESLLLAAMGGVLGIVAARFVATMLMRIIMSGTFSIGPSPRLDIPLDARVLMFTITVTVLAALLFGLMPAIASLVSAPAPALRQSGAAQPRSRRLFGNGLVVAQVAISLALLSVSHLSIAHLRHLRDRSLGFDRNSVLLISINTSRAQNRQQLAALYRDIVPRLEAIPGVRAVAASGTTPIARGAASRFLQAEGFDEPVQERGRVSLNWVSPNYFATYETPLLAGRDFRDADLEQPRRVIVNQTLARRYFAGRDPIGLHVWLENERDPYEIVGVAGDAKYQEIRLAAPPTVYLFAPMSRGSTTLSLRTDVNPIAVAADARRIVNDVLGADSAGRVTTLAEQVDAAVVPERLMAILGGFFGAVGALLAAIGLYGLLAYTVARRTKEIGIRMALGATRGDVTRMMLRSGLTLVAAGLVAGAPVALWGTRFAGTAIEDLSGAGVPSVATAVAAMLVVAALAAFMPARRATRVEPVIALRSE
jgi:putative ABC transport system permease protein